MNADFPSISTDQIAAFVELARAGSIRAAAEVLHITEQGVRDRLLTLEERLKVELYRKARGRRRTPPLTAAGRDFLPHAQTFLESACDLAALFGAPRAPGEIHVAASQYLLTYVLIDAVRHFHASHPQLRIRISTHNERDIEQVLMNDPSVTLGVAAPYEPPVDLQYQHMFSLNWSLITPRRHRLAGHRRIRLKDVVDESLILFERGSTGRQHILDAFAGQNLHPNVHMETTTTEIVVRMVEASLGVAIVPLLSSGAVTRGKKVNVIPIVDRIRPINSGILTRRGETLSPVVEEFIAGVRNEAM